jgi:hypothetical protein
MDLAASLLDSMKASSPRHAKFAAAADQEDWMVKSTCNDPWQRLGNSLLLLKLKN